MFVYFVIANVPCPCFMIHIKKVKKEEIVDFLCDCMENRNNS